MAAETAMRDGAEPCATTGEAAFARVSGRIVRGWYGSTVVDGETLVLRGEGLPQGPVSDAVLRRALADGHVYDPEPLLQGETALADVPDDVVSVLVEAGVADALRALDAPADGTALHVPPVFRVGVDDPLTAGAAAALLGHRRHRGPDLVEVGILAAVGLRARGLPIDPAAVARGILDGLRERDAVLDAILAAPMA